MSPEVISHILFLARLGDQNVSFTLSQVNTHLRDIIIATPLLWNSLDIMYPENRTALHLERSAGVHLNVSMSLAPSVAVADGKTRLASFASRLSPHYHRIRRLDAAFVHPEWTRVAADFVYGNNLKNLRTLDLGTICNSEPIDPIGDSANVWRVKDLCLRRVFPANTHKVSALGLRRLKLLRNPSLNFTDLLKILMKTPSLQDIELDQVHFQGPAREEVDTQGISVKLNHLKNIKLVYIIEQDVAAISKSIQAPLLDSLTIHSAELIDLTGPRQFLRLKDDLLHALSSYQSIKKLDLGGCFMKKKHWNAVLSALPSLTHLRFVGSYLKNADLALLGAEYSGEPSVVVFPYVCPALVELAFENEFSLTSGAVKNIVQARFDSPHASPIASLTMRGWAQSNVSPEDAALLCELVPHFILDVFGGPSGGALEDQDESESESSSDNDEGSWASGDEDVVRRRAP